VAIRGLTIGAASPQYLSESSFILAVGVATAPWHGSQAGPSRLATATSAANLPDYRGGISLARGMGHTLCGESSGWFADTTLECRLCQPFRQRFSWSTIKPVWDSLWPPRRCAAAFLERQPDFDSQRRMGNFGDRAGTPNCEFFAAQIDVRDGYLLRGAYLINTGIRGGPEFHDFARGLVCVHSLAWRSSWRAAHTAISRTSASSRRSGAWPEILFPSASSGSPLASRGFLWLAPAHPRLRNGTAAWKRAPS